MKTQHSLCLYTQNDSNVFAHMLQLIYIIHIYIAKTRLSFCTSTCLHDAVNQSIFRFIRLMYMHRNYIHCEDITQTLLIYTEQQQRLYAHIATHIHHIHIYCKTKSSTDDSDLLKHMIYQINRQVIEHNRTIKTSLHSTQ